LGSCLAKDIFVAIDASESIKAGWYKQTNFARYLVAKMVGQGNRVNVHWFNDVTYPVTGQADTTAPGNLDGKGPETDYPYANDIGTFVKTGDIDFEATFDDLEVAYKEGEPPEGGIKDKDTDHPQVFLTAEASFTDEAASRPTLVLITDGVTHSGYDCKANDYEGIKNIIKKCEEKKGPCYHKDSTMEFPQQMCKNSKCPCGVFKAEKFKENYDLVVVGVKNLNHDKLFTQMMKGLAKNDQFYPIDIERDDLNDLKTLANTIGGDLCYS
jgi:hypothetical protein